MESAVESKLTGRIIRSDSLELLKYMTASAKPIAIELFVQYIKHPSCVLRKISMGSDENRFCSKNIVLNN